MSDKSALVFTVVVPVAGSLATGDITSPCGKYKEVIATNIPKPLPAR